MKAQIERPLDLLNSLKGKEVLVKCRAYEDYEVEGVLHALDIHINLVLEVNEGKKKILRFVRGENVIFVEENF